MQRDVKVGLVLGVMLVSVIAVVFFRKDEQEQEKLSHLLPSPEVVVDGVRDALGPSPTEPYPVAPEYLADRWQGSAPQPARTPAPPRGRASDAPGDDLAPESKKTAGAASAVLLPPDTETTKSTRAKRESAVPGSRQAKSEGATRSNQSGNFTEYTIQENDTLTSIASRFLGSSQSYALIFEENRDVLHDPNIVPVGQKIRIPNLKTEKSAPLAVASQPNLPRRQVEPPRPAESRGYELYEVREGDTLIGIAKDRYKKVQMYMEIFYANQDQLSSPDDVRPGMVLKLP